LAEVSAKTRLYCFSGTGNTRRVARWTAAATRRRGIGASVHMIRHGMERPSPPEQGELTGLLTPTHGFTAPWSVISFALRLPWGGGGRAFVAATRGGTKFGPVFVPGLAASTCFLLALILLLRGYRVSGAASFNMASNWMSLHSGFRRDNARAINRRSVPKVRNFIDTILDGRSRWFTLNNLYEAIGALLLSFISVLYLLVGRFCLATAFFANGRCNGCNRCVRHCPVGAIVHRDAGRRPYWRHTCESCMRCMAWCPTGAVEANQPYLVLISIAMLNIPWLALIGRHLFFWADGFVKTVLVWSVLIVAMYPIIAAGAVLLRALNRMRVPNRVMTLLTGTHYYRRYHEPGTRLESLPGARR
jgi:ferredoxin